MRITKPIVVTIHSADGDTQLTAQKCTFTDTWYPDQDEDVLTVTITSDTLLADIA
jgi:hypothetical protein